MAAPEPPFFIGWSKTPARLRDFVIGVGFGIVVLLAMAGFMVAATQNDPGDGAFVGGAEAVGILTAKPYPVLQVTESAAFPAGPGWPRTSRRWRWHDPTRSATPPVPRTSR